MSGCQEAPRRGAPACQHAATPCVVIEAGQAAAWRRDGPLIHTARPSLERPPATATSIAHGTHPFAARELGCGAGRYVRFCAPYEADGKIGAVPVEERGTRWSRNRPQ